MEEKETNQGTIKMKKKQTTREKMNKERILFSVDPSILAEFRYHCKRKKLNMSQLIQKYMHDFSVKNAEV